MAEGDGVTQKQTVGKTIGHYRLLARIGEGGMGVVFKAEDLLLQRTVALKFLSHASADHDSVERFLQEARAASSLDHPNICTIHDIGHTDDGQLFICMAFCEGESLRARIDRAPLTYNETRTIITQVARGLAKAHEGGIIHRDITPANIIVTNDGVVKIIDFGLAKLRSAESLTRSGHTIGTLQYMSPEQLNGETLDERTDLWSLGVVLHECLAGEAPFTAEHPAALMYAIMHQTAPQLRNLRPDIPDDLWLLAESLLSKDRSKRPATARDVLRVLGDSGEPVTVPGPRRMWRRMLLWVPGTIVLLAGGGYLTFTLLFPPAAFPLTPSERVVIAPFRNLTGEPFFNNSLNEALMVSLQQTSQFTIVPKERVTSTLGLMHIEADQPPDERTALEVARREAARVLLAGEIGTLGRSYVLSCRILDVARGQTVRIVRADAATPEDVLSGMDRLCERVRRELGESMVDISFTSRPLARVTTFSIEALELFTRGDSLEGKGRFADAAALKERALSLDPGFVMAISDLSYVHRKLGNDSLAVLYHRRVLPLIDRVTDHERRMIEAIYYGPTFEMDFPKSLEALQRLLARYPDDPWGVATLGHLAMWQGDLALALDANSRAARILPEYTATCYNNSGFALAMAGRAREALGYLRQSRALRRAYYLTDEYIAKAFWIMGERDSAEASLWDPERELSPLHAAQERNLRGALHYFHGEVQGAGAEWLAALDLFRRIGRPADVIHLEFLLGEAAGAAGRIGEYRSALLRTAAACPSPYLELPLIATSFARNGYAEDATTVLHRLENLRSDDPHFVVRRESFLHLVRGQIALARSQFAAAQRHFASVKRLRKGDIYALLAEEGAARASESQGDTTAQVLYEQLLQKRGEIIMAVLSSTKSAGPWQSWLLPEVHLRSAELAVRRGDAGTAIRHRAALTALWRDAPENAQLAGRYRAVLTTPIQSQP